jgi:hypothetical protein
VFSSASQAESYCHEYSIEGARAAQLQLVDGSLLERFASIDHCSGVIEDGTEAIRFFSCESTTPARPTGAGSRFRELPLIVAVIGNALWTSPWYQPKHTGEVGEGL